MFGSAHCRRDIQIKANHAHLVGANEKPDQVLRCLRPQGSIGARPLRRLRTWGKTQSIATIDNQSSGYSGNVEAADLFKIAFQMTGSIQDLSSGAADGAAFSICKYI
jgi:hypothetical protein